MNYDKKIYDRYLSSVAYDYVVIKYQAITASTFQKVEKWFAEMQA